MAPVGLDDHQFGCVLQVRYFYLAILGLEKKYRRPIQRGLKRTYRKIEIRPSWHNETFSFDIGQALPKVPTMPDGGDIAHLPCFEQSQHVVRIP